MGKGAYPESVEMVKKYGNFFFDTSTCFYEVGISGAETAKNVFEIMRIIGADRIRFGTDWSWHDPLIDINYIEKMELDDEEKAGILGLNARRVYNPLAAPAVLRQAKIKNFSKLY
jgi:predicted TIM-barrel fold metal-dependent hydrolase